MQCQNCGHDRPRQGNCPHCGAPIGGSNSQGGGRSSMRDWRQEPSRGTPSRPLNPPDRSYSGRSSSSSGRRQSGTDWGAPGQSYPRRGDPNQSYPRRGWNDPDDRALMPIPDTGDLMVRDDRMLPTLPSEEEERAMGIRRPAFIPATEERKGRRPSRWRVLSGVASVLVLCVGISAFGGFLAQRNLLPVLSRLTGASKPGTTTISGPSLPAVYYTPIALVTPGSKTTPITNVLTTTAVTQNPNKPITPAGPTTALFVVGGQINVLCDVNQTAKNGDVVSIRWIINGTDITTTLQGWQDKTRQTVAKNTSGYEFYFALSLPTPGIDQALLYYNTTLAYTIDFAVENPPSASPTPAPTKTSTPKPSQTPVATATAKP